MSIKKHSRKELQKRIRKKQGIKELIEDIVLDSPNLFLQELGNDLMRPYLSHEEVTEFIKIAIEKDPKLLVKHANTIREHIPDNEVRERILEFTKKYTWVSFTSYKEYTELFPVTYFEDVLRERDLNEEEWNIFLLNYGNFNPNSFGDERLREYLASKISQYQSDCRLGGSLDPGFACGGLESNFLSAITNREGIAIVNGQFLTKFHHRRVEAKKISLVPERDSRSLNGFPIWSNYVYAPNSESVERIKEEIKKGSREITIDDLILKSVRPLIEVKSSDLFGLYWQNQ